MYVYLHTYTETRIGDDTCTVRISSRHDFLKPSSRSHVGLQIAFLRLSAAHYRDYRLATDIVAIQRETDERCYRLWFHFRILRIGNDGYLSKVYTSIARFSTFEHFYFKKLFVEHVRMVVFLFGVVRNYRNELYFEKDILKKTKMSGVCVCTCELE